MKEDFSELVEYLDGKFNTIDGKFERVDEKFNKVDERFDKVDEKFNKVDERFDKVEEELGGIKGEMLGLKENLADKADKIDIDNLLTAIDGYAKKADTYFQEMVVLSHKVDRHEKWLLQLADKLGVKLEY